MTAPPPGHEHGADRIAGWLALAGSALGVLAGLIELTIGPDIRAWVGDKQDTTRLGLTTIALSLAALGAALALRRPRGRAGAGRVAVSLGLLAPGLVCFTTVGRLWYVPGALLVVSATVVLASTRPDDLAAAVDERRWRIGLLAGLGACHVLLGATALGAAGALGIAGGLLLWSVAPVAARSHGAAWAILLAGAVPFAAATWWSVVTPVVATLAIVIGMAVIRDATTGLAAPRGTPAPG